MLLVQYNYDVGLSLWCTVAPRLISGSLVGMAHAMSEISFS